jgi:hypothetical protein
MFSSFSWFGYSKQNHRSCQEHHHVCLAMSIRPLNDAEISDIRFQLNELQVEHRDLDQVILHLIEMPPPDELLVRRLKKRKLLLKDRILLLEQMLIPDIPA